MQLESKINNNNENLMKNSKYQFNLSEEISKKTVKKSVVEFIARKLIDYFKETKVYNIIKSIGKLNISDRRIKEYQNLNLLLKIEKYLNYIKKFVTIKNFENDYLTLNNNIDELFNNFYISLGMNINQKEINYKNNHNTNNKNNFNNINNNTYIKLEPNNQSNLVHISNEIEIHLDNNKQL
ncbi:6438_t:CDS:2 [Cetraspora pellucida]|uniref:6438_t:CDS:1 n=1 Tax=Cetraspora pellucida TaxID=1433469 RepID=A0A9N9NMA1_9GLOM|nr:6438_t:CDS:2 [Cetraspora pellucida]